MRVKGKLRAAIETVVGYNWSDEIEDYVENCSDAPDGNQRKGHVFESLVRIANATFQSDCMLIGGDSGGPLFDLTGKLVGIHSRVGQQMQVNMHVPMTEFITNWEGMLKAEFIGEGPYAEKPVKGNGFLGLATESRTEGGLRVTKVGDKSPAQEAGIKEGDVLLKMNGVGLEKRGQMQELLKEMSAGDELNLETERGGKAKTFTLNLGER